MLGNGLFNIDPNATPQEVERRRRQIMAQLPNFGNARYAGQGAAHLASGLVGGIANRQLNRAGQDASKRAGPDVAPTEPQSFSAMAKGDPNGFTVLGMGRGQPRELTGGGGQDQLAGGPGADTLMPQLPSFAPGAIHGQDGRVIAPPLGGDEMQVGRPFPNEQMPQMGGSPAIPSSAAPDARGLTGGELQIPPPTNGAPLPGDIQAQLQSMTPDERQLFMQRTNEGYSPQEAIQPEGYQQFNAQERSLAPPKIPVGGRDMPMQAPLSGGGGDASLFGQDAGGDLEPVPTPDELASMAERIGIQQDDIRGLDLNSTEARNFGYLLRMMEAEAEIRELSDANTWGQRFLELIPGRDIESLFMDPEYRRLVLSRENFNEAALRAATGATINSGELPRQRQNYFPLPSDDEETRALIQRQREALMMSLVAGSGPAGALVPQIGQSVVPRGDSGPVERPADVGQDVWDVMTPEERELFR